MTWLRTPPKTRGVTVAIYFTILVAPFVVGHHFFVRLLRGDYPWDADAIAIPIFTFFFFIYPITVFFLARGLARRYTPGVFLLGWGRRELWRCLLVNVVMIYPTGLFSVVMILDGFAGRLYGTAVFFLAHLYSLLVLRASILAKKASPSSLV